MKFEPILKIKIQKFKDEYGFCDLDDNKVFELFVNHNLLMMYQPNYKQMNSSLLENVSVGGENDTGIDGLAIKVNDCFVTTKQEVEAMLKYNKTIEVEFIFVQSKNKSSLISSEFAVFSDGICDFLSETQNEPHNAKIDSFLELKRYLCSDEITILYNSMPTIKVFYAISGEWHEDEHFNAKIEALNDRLSKFDFISDYSIRHLDASSLIRIHEENNNSFTTVINWIGNLELQEVEKIDDSQVILCQANEFLKLLVGEEDNLRRSLFADNIRDFQGNTNINEDMLETIKHNPSEFLLKNNGITIVCSKLIRSIRKFTITNPQIVNGCQTSNVIYKAHKEKLNLDNVYLLIKIIATNEDNIANSIVKGTNSQNPVYVENFEIIRKFHKSFEDFVHSIQSTYPEDDKIYYERRAKQFEYNQKIKKFRIFGLDLLTKSVLSCFIRAPHESVKHVLQLLSEYKNAIFVDNQSLYPYFVSALLCLNFERAVLEKQIDPFYDSFKYFIISIFAEKTSAVVLDINHFNIDKSCEKILKVINNKELFVEEIKKSILLFDEARKLWVTKRGLNYAHAIKDNPDFTNFLFTYIRGGDVDKLNYSALDVPLKIGKVLHVKQDRHGSYYGFISAEPDNVFFHSEDNRSIDFTRIVGKTVLYKVINSPKSNREKAIGVKVYK